MFIIAILSLITVIAVASSFYCWQKYSLTHMLWKESSNKLQIARNKAISAQNELDKLKENLSSTAKILARSESELKSFKEDNFILQQKNSILSKEQIERLVAEDNSKKFEDAKLKYEIILKEKSSFESQLEEQKIIIQDLKSRIIKSDRLYLSMKGLREMSEEKNRNWEHALKSLSSWIIKRHDAKQLATLQTPPTNVASANIGELVGAALELTKTKSSVNDEF